MTAAPVFRPTTMRAAMDIILTPEAGMTPDERWVKETPWIIEQVNHLLTPGDVVIDFGCGVGRLIRELGQRHCMIGVDESFEMRRLALDYCANIHGLTLVDPWGLNGLASRGLQADVAMAVWSLQHIPDLKNHVRWLHSAVKPGGFLFVLNSTSRWLPIENGWTNDQLDVPTELAAVGFRREIWIDLPRDLFGPDKWCAVFRKE